MARGGRQTTGYSARFGQTDNPNASSAERATQQAFGAERSGGLQRASKGARISAAIGDIIVVDNTDSATASRPVITLPKLTAKMTGKTVQVTGITGSSQYYRLTCPDTINDGTQGQILNITQTAPEYVYVFLAISPDYGWRWGALEF